MAAEDCGTLGLFRATGWVYRLTEHFKPVPAWVCWLLNRALQTCSAVGLLAREKQDGHVCNRPPRLTERLLGASHSSSLFFFFCVCGIHTLLLLTAWQVHLPPVLHHGDLLASINKHGLWQRYVHTHMTVCAQVRVSPAAV